MEIREGFAGAVGNTPLIRLARLSEETGCEEAIGWALYTKDKAFFNVPAVKRAISAWPDGSTAGIVWTDKDSNLVSIINWRGQ